MAVCGGIAGCYDYAGVPLPSRVSAPLTDADGELIARFVHISDMHIVDEESPARMGGAHIFTRSAWRPYEAYSTQLLDGILRAVNRVHAGGRKIDFLVHTGDSCDNAQLNELAWMTGIFDGSEINPLSGRDDRPANAKPAAVMDPHAIFTAQGLYRAGVHGDAASIPWYGVFGNHDVYGIGVFPIVDNPFGGRNAPLPFDWRLDILLPGELNPIGPIAHALVTPGSPGPPELFALPVWLEPNPDRAYFTRRQYVEAMFDTITAPPGHGFASPDAPTWYSVSPAPGVRLIGLDSCDPVDVVPGLFYVDGAISAAQLSFLRAELDAARQAGDLVIVASHHPSSHLLDVFGTAANGAALRALLNEYPNVILHLAGHTHRNRVTSHDGYLEIETCSTLDQPQEGRIIEVRRNAVNGEIIVGYEMLSHLDENMPALGEDPLRGMREEALRLAGGDNPFERGNGYIGGASEALASVADGGAGYSPRGRDIDRLGFAVLPARALRPKSP